MQELTPAKSHDGARRPRVVASTFAGWLLLVGFGAMGAELPAPAAVHAEIGALLADLEASGCRFQRNGQWHTGAEARVHLQRKWLQMEGRKLASTTEQFIEQGASRSLVSGQPYLVQCNTESARSSEAWLRSMLLARRAGGR